MGAKNSAKVQDQATTMTKKEKTTIYINGDVKKKAAEMGLNLSKTCENALRVATGNLSFAYRLLKPGFEPGKAARETGRGPLSGLRPPEPITGDRSPTAALYPGVSVVSVALSPHQVFSDKQMAKFKDFLEVDQELAERTVYGHVWLIGRFSSWIKDRAITRETIREYLKHLKRENPGEYKNTLSALKKFFRDFQGRGDLVATFKFPGKQFPLKRIPTKKKLQKFYKALEKLDLRAACYFLLWATSGWRFKEVFVLHREDVDLETRMLTHRLPSTTTKGRLPGCFNEEAENVLKKWNEKRSDKSPKLLPINEGNLRRIWRQAEEASGVHLTPQMLREWFCEEMGELDVKDRYIDAFCGRTPKSVLAKHYTDYLPHKLKKIYDKAGLRVLS